MKHVGVAVDTLSLTVCCDRTRQIASREKQFWLTVLLHAELFTVTFPYKQREVLEGGGGGKKKKKKEMVERIFFSPVFFFSFFFFFLN